ncbi:ribosome maturation protein SBDS, partial [Thraustotheca clavata]
VFQEIATIVAEKCVNPESNRPYPFTVIERAMKEMHYALVPNRSAKQQALEVIKKLKEHMPITRAKMKVQVTVATSDGDATKEFLAKHEAVVVEVRTGEVLRIICLIDPSTYRTLDQYVNPKGSKDASRSLEVLDLSCHEQGEHTIDDEIAKKTDRLTLETPAPVPAPMVASAAPEVKKPGRPCSTCGGDFPDTVKYREHFRSEWHRYNLKLKSKSLPLVDEATFQTIDPADVQKVYETLE